jgi:hypothetical protein
MLACDNPQIQSTPPQEFAFDAAVTGLAFLAEGTLATGLSDGSVRLIPPGDGITENHPTTSRGSRGPRAGHGH